MDLLLIIILLLLLFGGAGGLYWGMGWGIGPLGLILLALIICCLLFAYRGRRRR